MPATATRNTDTRIVTADTARRCRLWNRDRLLLEGPFGTHRLSEVGPDLTAESEPDEPGVQPKWFELRPGQSLLFIPSR